MIQNNPGNARVCPGLQAPMLAIHRCRKQTGSVEAMLCCAKCFQHFLAGDFAGRSAAANFSKSACL